MYYFFFPENNTQQRDHQTHENMDKQKNLLKKSLMKKLLRKRFNQKQCKKRQIQFYTKYFCFKKWRSNIEFKQKIKMAQYVTCTPINLTNKSFKESEIGLYAHTQKTFLN